MESESHQQLGYGLLRFRSAPSSLLTNETEKFTSRFLSYGNNNSNSGGTMYEEKSPSSVKESPAAVSPRGYSGLPPHYPRPSSGMGSSAMDGSYGLVSSITVDHHHSQPKSVTSNLTRQNSSPPDLFSHLSPQNGYAPGRGTGNFRGASGFNGEISPSSNRLKGQTSFSSGLPSSLGMLSQISEFGSENLGSADARLGVGNLDTRFCGPAFPFNSWSDSSHFSENFTGLKRERENDVKMFSGGQNGEIGNRHTMLSHHLSLPRTSSEMVAVEKFLQLQDSVPCKIRAKRGCATHPRSIAERVRRTRISERMRKLQELVPNMDKQTNTADMLDLAVDYIKDLQKQFKTLSDNRANCKCLSMQKPV